MDVDEDRFKKALQRVRDEKPSLVHPTSYSSRPLPPPPRTLGTSEVSISREDEKMLDSASSSHAKQLKKTKGGTVMGTLVYCTTCNVKRLQENHGEDHLYRYAKCPDCKTENRVQKAIHTISAICESCDGTLDQLVIGEDGRYLYLECPECLHIKKVLIDKLKIEQKTSG